MCLKIHGMCQCKTVSVLQTGSHTHPLTRSPVRTRTQIIALSFITFYHPQDPRVGCGFMFGECDAYAMKGVTGAA